VKIRHRIAVFAFCAFVVGADLRLCAQAGAGTQTQGNANSQEESSARQQTQSSDPNQGPPFYTPGPAYTGQLPGNSVIVTNPQPLTAPAADENTRQGAGRLDDDEVLRTPSHRYNFIYGSTVSSIYQDQIPNGNGTTNNVGVLATPYVSLIRFTHTGSYAINYSASVMPYQSVGTSTAVFHNISLTATGMWTRRWQWSVSTSTEYGNEAARIAGPLSFELAGGFPIADAGFAVLTPFNYNTVAAAANATLSWRPTQRDSISFSTMSGYTNLLTPAGRSMLGTAASENVGWEISYNHALSRALSINEYADLIRSVGPLDPFSKVHCNVYGGGVGLNIDPDRAVSMAVGGGPQISGPGCGGSQQAVNAWGLVMVRPGPHTRLYAQANREFTAVYGLSGHWADTATAGVTRDFRSLELSLDGAAIRGQISTASGFISVRGLFAGPEVQYRFWRTLSMMVGYRIFRGSTTPYGTGSMNFATAGLQWTPRAVGFPR
jgi:hypothetical protein